MQLKRRMLVSLASVVLVFSVSVSAQAKNGFDLSNVTINVDNILRGGPPKDGIPAIDNPKFVSAAEVDYLKGDDIVLGIVRGSDVRAYPLRILVWHEIVNDTVGTDPLAITYCPLCGTAMVFERHINGELKTFGVSGLLYQSDVLLYDRQSESLWSQLAMKSISGKEVNTPLNWVNSQHLTWQAWREKYPNSLVLSTDTGFSRAYQAEAYASYFASDETMFPVPHQRTELANKETVIGVIINGKAKAYPVSKLPSNTDIQDSVGNQAITIRYDASNKHPTITNAQGQSIPSVMVFWFAWQAFYPQTALWGV